AKLAGARVIAITSSAEKGEQAKNSGADIVLNRNEGDYWQEIANLTNQRGVDVVIENVGKATWSQSIDSLKKGGRLVTYGRTSGHLVETDIKKIFWNQLSILGSTMGSRQDFYQVMQLVFKGKLKPVIDSVYPLEQAADAYQRLKDGNHFGKVIVKIN
ncbi:MAG: zinc-binding dehydrogenase, partial [Gammaproteobacteria bacterium]|nr:zinc-binding dehydrogenase [Gammaproteobacteria bacterium]MDH5631022.1 zinc-binding dehydrogenase [Gammaproteobacteria bacterium]